MWGVCNNLLQYLCKLCMTVDPSSLMQLITSSKCTEYLLWHICNNIQTSSFLSNHTTSTRCNVCGLVFNCNTILGMGLSLSFTLTLIYCIHVITAVQLYKKITKNKKTLLDMKITCSVETLPCVFNLSCAVEICVS